MNELCLPWEPIPNFADHVWDVDVVHVEESFQSTATGLAISVASSWNEPASGDRVHGAWRLFFTYCVGYRMRSYGYAGNLPLVRPDAVKAFWKIAPSQYLAEFEFLESSLVKQKIGELQHFVVCTGANTVYEVVARNWTSEPLPDEWARPFLPLDAKDSTT